MIPNALANTGPYADFWGHLKSIDHALERAINTITNADYNIERTIGVGETTSTLTDLDKDRLNAMVLFFKSALNPRSTDSAESRTVPSFLVDTHLDYSSTIDVRQKITAVREFEEWQKTAKKGIESKLQRLIDSVENYLNNASASFIPEAPKEEFEILQAIIQSLLSEAEIALQY